MKKIIFMLSVIGICMLCVSCSKNKTDNPVSGNANLINKWNLVKGIFVDSLTGYTDNVDVVEGSYLRFDANGICYSMVDGDSDAGDWHYINNNTGLFIATISTFDYQNTNFNIETINEHSLVLKSTNIVGVEATLTLSK